MPAPSIAQQVDTFNEEFTAQIGPELSAVFDGEQRDLRAAGVPSGVIGVGERFPDADLLTPTGAGDALADVRGDGVSVLVFYRGAWCPYCNLTLRTYQQELLPALRDRGVPLIARHCVAGETPRCG